MVHDSQVGCEYHSEISFNLTDASLTKVINKVLKAGRYKLRETSDKNG